MAGFFISFEGIDGCGKSVQVALLGKALAQLGNDVVFTKEPGDATTGSNVGGGLRKLLFTEPSTKNMHPGVADCLFLADHIQNEGDIRAYVAAGKIVICDRYADSQFAYSASEGKKCPAWALAAYRENYGILPDLTFLLRARGPEVVKQRGFFTIKVEDIGWALTRAQSRRGVEAGKQDGKAWNSIEEQRRIQVAYLDALLGQERVEIIDVWEKDTIEDVHNRLFNIAVARLAEHFETEGLKRLLGSFAPQPRAA